MSIALILNDYSPIQNYTRYKKTEMEETAEKKRETVSELKRILIELQASANEAADAKVCVVDMGKNILSDYYLFDDSAVRQTHEDRDSKEQSGEESKPYSEHMNQYVGILYYKDEKEEYYLSLRSRFDEREGFFTEYILSKVLGACGYSFNKRLFREEDLASALKRLMEIAFLMQIDKYYCADAIRDDDLGNETNQLILLTYRRLHARDNSEWDSSWIDCMVNSHDNLKDYISRMNEYWKTSHLPDVGTFLNRNRAHTESQIRGWDKVIKTACMIQHFMNSKGANERMAGVLFDMNDLWELYLKSIFGEKNKNNSGFQLLYQWEEDILLPFGKDKGRRAIRPDFCFRTRNRYSMVLDAKNKISWAKIVEADGKDSFEKDVWRGEKSIRGDIFEVLAYMFALGCPVGGIICPVKLSAKNDYKPVSYRISHFEGAEFFVAGLPTNCPSGFRADFKEYKRIMRKREKILWEAIIGKEKT